MIKKAGSLFLITVMMCFGVTVFATTYNAGQLASLSYGASSIGTGGDYPTLYAAAQDFNTTANVGSWTFYILNSLTESSNEAWGHPVLSSSTITLRPAVPGITLSFITVADNNGKSGSIVIGNSSINSSDATQSPIQNFIIDGSASPQSGDSTKDMTIQSAVNVPGSSGIDPWLVIDIWGACTNVVVKNCNIYAQMTTADVNLYYPIQIESRKNTTATPYSPISTNLIPFGVQILNNYIVATADLGGVGIYLVGSGTPTLCINSTVISGNTILAQDKGIYNVGANNLTISNNTIQMNESNTGLYTQGIYHLDSISAGTTWIYGNVINQLYSACTYSGYGITGIDVSVGDVATQFYIYNNEITGFNFTVPNSATGVWCLGIRASGVVGNAFSIENNSINIVSQPNLTAVSQATTWGIVLGAGPNFTGNRVVQNNIVRVGAINGGVCFAIASTNSSGGANFNYNDFFAASGANVGQLNGTQPGAGTYSTLSAWTTALITNNGGSNNGGDLNSQAVDPFSTSPSGWISNSNLHFNPYAATPTGTPSPSVGAAPLTSGTPVTFITKDIDGQTRSLTTPWEGCDELYTLLFASPTSLYLRTGIAPVQLIGYNGTAPYTWTVSTSAIGSLNTSSGATVLFSVASSFATGTITITDSSVPMQSFVVPVIISPTSAHMAKDISMTAKKREHVVGFELFQ